MIKNNSNPLLGRECLYDAYWNMTVAKKPEDRCFFDLGNHMRLGWDNDAIKAKDMPREQRIATICNQLGDGEKNTSNLKSYLDSKYDDKLEKLFAKIEARQFLSPKEKEKKQKSESMKDSKTEVPMEKESEEPTEEERRFFGREYVYEKYMCGKVGATVQAYNCIGNQMRSKKERKRFPKGIGPEMTENQKLNFLYRVLASYTPDKDEIKDVDFKKERAIIQLDIKAYIEPKLKNREKFDDFLYKLSERKFLSLDEKNKKPRKLKSANNNIG